MNYNSNSFFAVADYYLSLEKRETTSRTLVIYSTLFGVLSGVVSVISAVYIFKLTSEGVFWHFVIFPLMAMFIYLLLTLAPIRKYFKKKSGRSKLVIEWNKPITDIKLAVQNYTYYTSLRFAVYYITGSGLTNVALMTIFGK